MIGDWYDSHGLGDLERRDGRFGRPGRAYSVL